MKGTRAASRSIASKFSRSCVMSATLLISMGGMATAMADPAPVPVVPTTTAAPTPPTGGVPSPVPNTETPTPVTPSITAPVPALTLCSVVRGNKTRIDDTTWPLKVATKTENWDWSDGDVAEARTRINTQLPALIENLQQGKSAPGSSETSSAVQEAITAGKQLVTTITQNGDGSETSSALGEFDKALDDSLRSCVGV